MDVFHESPLFRTLKRIKVRVNEEHWESSYPGNLPLVRSGLADWRDYWTDKKPCSCEQGSEASIVGRKARTKFYGRNLRRASPAKPIKPVPINPSVPGSGVVTVKSPLTEPVFDTTKVNPATTGLPPMFALMLVTPLLLLTVPSKLPWKRSWLLPFQTSIVPPLKQSPAEQLESVPVLIFTVPEAGVKFKSSKEEVTLKVLVAVAVPEVLAVVPSSPPKAKSMLSASAAVGSARANSANKNTRLINHSSKIDPV
jgi:hypothetical protein